MTIENVPLFDLFKPDEASAAQLLAALNDSIDPNTGEYSEELSDELGDLKYAWRTESTPIGTFENVTNWNHGDGHEQGQVVKHVESGLYFMITGTYSSWDSSDWEEWKLALPYQFTETRYKVVDNG